MCYLKHVRRFLRLTWIMLVIGASNGLLAQKEIRIGSGGKTGVYYPFAQAIADICNKKLNVKAKGISTGGSAFNCKALKDGDLNMAMVQNDVAFYAYENIEQVAHNPHLRAVGSLYSEDVHIVVRRDSGIRTIADMSGKRISIGNPDSGQFRNASQILKAAGVFNEIDVDYSKVGQAVKLMGEGKIDGLFYTAGWPNKAIQELTKQAACRFIALDQNLIEKLLNEYPFYVKSFISEPTYQGADPVVTSVAVRAMLVAHEDLPASLVYAVTKLIYENTALLEQFHAKWKSVNFAQARKGVGIPFHEGARAYLQRQTIPVRKQAFSIAPIIGYTGRGLTLDIVRERWNMQQIALPDGELGWIPKSQMTQISNKQVDGYTVSANALNFRITPTLNSLPIGLLYKGDKVERVKQHKNQAEGIVWYKVRRGNGDVGWASAKFLKATSFLRKSGTIVSLSGALQIQKAAESKWLKGGWRVDAAEVSLADKAARLTHLFSNVDRTSLHDALNIFELSNGMASSKQMSKIVVRLKKVEHQLDVATREKIFNYLKSVEARF